eukprot:gene9612-12944_t
MADALEDNIWMGENEVNLSNKNMDEDDYDLDEGDMEQKQIDENKINLLEKMNKKKRKIILLKEKRKLLKLNSDTDNILNSDTDNIFLSEKVADTRDNNTSNKIKNKRENNSTATLDQLTTKQKMVDLLTKLSRIPSKDLDTTPVKLTEENFFGEQECSNKRICPFSNIIINGIISYKKVLSSKNVPKYFDNHGCPMVVIVCSSAVRAIEIMKSLAKEIKFPIVKLFAKHLKLQEQMDILSKSYYPIAIGTPNRLVKLVEFGAITFKYTKLLIIDIKKDVKNFNILTMNSVNQDLKELMHKCIYNELEHLKISLIE